MSPTRLTRPAPPDARPTPRRAAPLLAVLSLAAACGDKPAPAVVEPADDAPVASDGTTPDAPAPVDSAPSHDSHAANNPNASGIWVEDDNGVAVGLLVRRGSDDQLADRAIYDIVTVFHPGSGLFFEITMSDAVVRYPQNTYFRGFDCDTPIGIGVGACTACKSGYGSAFMHAGLWYKVKGGQAFDTMAPDALFKGGMGTECIAHGTSNAKGYPVQQVIENPPPSSFAPPLAFVAK